MDLREKATLVPDAGFLRNRSAALDRDFVTSWQRRCQHHLTPVVAVHAGNRVIGAERQRQDVFGGIQRLHQHVAFIQDAEREIVLGSGAVTGVLVTAYLR